jgi:hypothetical protein
MRKAFVVALGVVAAVALALPVQAKVDGSAVISGPGIPGGGSGAGDGSGGGGSITMDGSDGAWYPLLSGMLNPARYLTTRPDGDLGPRYEARLVITVPKRLPDVIQHLYPFAEGGPVLYTPPGQEFVMSVTGEAPGGWYDAPGRLIRELHRRGLPSTSPAVTGPAGGTAAARSSGPGPSPVVWGFVLLAGLLVAGAVAGRRRAAVRRAG